MGRSPGTRLGPYEIRGPLGAGGMGEIYRARDPRLNREIAIKILPDAVAADLACRARFEREAQSLAALSHPNIVTIHSVEQAGSMLFLTMEFVDGKPLSVLIPEGGFPLDQMLGIAIALADAVSVAHVKGITPRDLKPTRDRTQSRTMERAHLRYAVYWEVLGRVDESIQRPGERSRRSRSL